MWIRLPAPAGCLPDIRQFPWVSAAPRVERDGLDWEISLAGPDPQRHAAMRERFLILQPRCFIRYRARSAAASNFSGVSPSAGYEAVPALAEREGASASEDIFS